jgi:excisionase family DNA binding protein
MHVNDDARWWTVKGAAEISSYSERSLREFIKDGRLEVVRPTGGRSIRIPDSALRNFMVGGARRPTAVAK